MAAYSELVRRLGTLATSIAALEVNAKRCACELDSLIEFATYLNPHSLPVIAPQEPLNVGRFVVNRRTFSVSDGRRVCNLGNSIRYRFFEFIASAPNCYFTRSQLLAAVWDGQRRAATTVRSTVFELRSRFRKVGMVDLANSICTNGRAYGLKFDDRLRKTQR
jgi:DNA-binding winged helix-turn-helix (wHTH) protein